ncbi:Uncharacterised protein [Vibrio cholerae]|nr:Uncharacterised protein [Vibrio cholerae]
MYYADSVTHKAVQQLAECKHKAQSVATPPCPFRSVAIIRLMFFLTVHP